MTIRPKCTPARKLGGGKYCEIVLFDIVVSESPGDSALLALQRATHATLHALSRELAGLRLTAAEINALANLADGRPRTVSELGAATGTRPTTLTSVLDRLQQHGHVTRGPHPGDRRAVLIELTGPGRRAAATIQRTLAGLEHRALAGLPADALAGFHTVLHALMEVSHDDRAL